MLMKSPRILLLALAGFFLAHTPNAQAQSFADWTGLVDGSPTGTANWDGYGTVSYSIAYFPNSNGVYLVGPQPTPHSPESNWWGDLDPWGMNATTGQPWLMLNSGSIDGTTDGVGYDITFTFSDGLGGTVFPSNDPVFYLNDVDAGDFIITASLGGNSVDASGWYYGVVQSASAEWAAANPTAPYPGSPSYWNAATSSLIGQGPSSTWVHQFKPTSDFDSITFTYVNGSHGDNIFFAIGDVAANPIPEPSGALLIGLSGALALLRRKRQPRSGGL